MSKGFSWALGILAVIGIALGAMLLPVWTTPSNCGGNSAALAAVNSYVTVTVVAAMDNPDRTFNPKAMTPEWRTQISHLPGADWVRHAHFLVSTVSFVPRSTEPRRVVIVCDTPYTNVPRQRFFRSPPTHAAGFSDGTTGLISPKVFAALDRSTFVAIDELYPEEKHPTEPADQVPQQTAPNRGAPPTSKDQL